jgi:hypothetical protein
VSGARPLIVVAFGSISTSSRLGCCTATRSHNGHSVALANSADVSARKRDCSSDGYPYGTILAIRARLESLAR